MAARAATGRGPSPAQAFCGLVGVVLIAAGALGFIGNASFGGADRRGSFLGLDVNGWHNLVHIATGVLLLAGAPRASAARAVCVIFGGAYALVAVLGFIDGSDVLGFVPIDTADNVLYTVLAVLALLVAAAPAPAGGRGGPPGDGRSILERYGAAYDASSPNQVFIGLRGSAS